MKKEDFNGLIDRWLTVGAVNQEQAVYMKSEVANFSAERSGDRFISIITFFGASALALGALLLIATNWPHLSKGIKLICSVV